MRFIIPDREVLLDYWLRASVIFPIGKAMTTKEIGAVLRATRVAQGLRQDQLAAAAGVGVRFLIELEAGKPSAQLGKALKVIEALGCRIQIEQPTLPSVNRK